MNKVGWLAIYFFLALECKATTRVAVCVSGALRTFAKAHVRSNFIENVVNPNNADVFFAISTESQNETDNFKMFTANYSWIKGVEVETKNEIQPLAVDSCMENHPLFHRIAKCQQLINRYRLQHNVDYDIIFRTRPDIKYVFPWTFESFANASDNTIYIPAPNNIMYLIKSLGNQAKVNPFLWGGSYYGVNDQVAWGRPRVMEIYSTINYIKAAPSGFAEGRVYNHLKKWSVAIETPFGIEPSNWIFRENSRSPIFDKEAWSVGTSNACCDRFPHETYVTSNPNKNVSEADLA